MEEARAMFERLTSAACNDLGLMAEEYDPRNGGGFLGNFPQALSHIALVNSAFNLARHEKPVEQRAEIRAAGE
jgi:GH15 family glucan-1,4-alpha-glucosidase